MYFFFFVGEECRADAAKFWERVPAGSCGQCWLGSLVRLGWKSCPGAGSKGKHRLLSLQPQPAWK